MFINYEQISSQSRMRESIKLFLKDFFSWNLTAMTFKYCTSVAHLLKCCHSMVTESCDCIAVSQLDL
jgi:hypothetical protein